MKTRKNAEQQNVALAMYERDECLEMLRSGRAFFLDDEALRNKDYEHFVSTDPDRWDDLYFFSQAPKLRINLDTIKEIKVVFENGHYHNAAIDEDGTIYSVVL